MIPFDETRHARDTAGKFTAHVGAEQPGTLDDDLPGDAGDEPRPVTHLTAVEANTLRKLPVARLMEVTRRLDEGPGEGYRETGPGQRQEIARQLGRGNLAAISGGRVVPLADGVELPVSNGYSVRVRLTCNAAYTVQRVFTRAGTESVKGQRTGVSSGQVSSAAYYASCFRSHGEQEWTKAAG